MIFRILSILIVILTFMGIMTIVWLNVRDYFLTKELKEIVDQAKDDAAVKEADDE
jgi:hypothetical protein